MLGLQGCTTTPSFVSHFGCGHFQLASCGDSTLQSGSPVFFHNHLGCPIPPPCFVVSGWLGFLRFSLACLYKFWGLNPGPCTLKASALPLSCLQSWFVCFHKASWVLPPGSMAWCSHMLVCACELGDRRSRPVTVILKEVCGWPPIRMERSCQVVTQGHGSWCHQNPRNWNS